MNDLRLTLRRLWVNAQGDVRAVNMNETTAVQEWADTSVLGVSLIGTAEGRRILWFQQFDFSSIRLDVQGRRIPDLEAQRVAVEQMERVLFPHLSTHRGRIAAICVPTRTQQLAIMTVLTKRWPDAMNHSISHSSWRQAINPNPAHVRGVRRPRVPFQNK